MAGTGPISSRFVPTTAIVFLGNCERGDAIVAYWGIGRSILAGNSGSFPIRPIGRLGGDAFHAEPNRVHGILVIDNGRDAVDRVSTDTETNGGATGHHNPMLHDNVSRIIRWYKGRTAFESRKTNPDFAWQTRFYDHIIRNRTSEDNIRQYIHNNPTRWKEDRFYL